MRWPWLRPFSAGAAVVFITFSIGWLIQQTRASHDLFILQYNRPTGWDQKAFKGKIDPAPRLPTTTDYVVQIANKCQVRSWKSETNMNTTDVNEMTKIAIPAHDVDSAMFNCLSSYVTPIYVTLTRTTN